MGDTYFEVAGLVDDAHAASADLLDATGYQENLITLEKLRCRMPELRKQQRAIEGVLQSVDMTARWCICWSGRREVAERQRVVRLRVQEILVGGDNITIRHSIPLPAFRPTRTMESPKP